jgi:hypothetical protein
MWPIQRGTGLISSLDAHSTAASDFAEPDGASFNGPGTADTWTAYQEIIASVPFDCAGFWIEEESTLGTNSAWQIQYARGAASSEVEIIRTGGQCASFWTNNPFQPMYVPLPLKRGERISARMMTSLTSTAVICRTNVRFVPASALWMPSFNRVEIVNLSPSAALPVSRPGVTYSAGPPIVGAIDEMLASTTTSWRAWSVRFTGNGVLGDMATKFQFFVRVGASSGVRFGGGFHPSAKARSIVDTVLGPFPCDIPVGSRILSEAILNATGPTYAPIIYGWS